MDNFSSEPTPVKSLLWFGREENCLKTNIRPQSLYENVLFSILKKNRKGEGCKVEYMKPFWPS